MKIGELSTKTGCSIQSIRFYERNGLLKSPERTEANYRLYDEDSLRQITFIKQCRSLDISIAEIKELISNKQEPNESCESINEMIDKHLIEVTNRIKVLTSLKSTLKEMKNSCRHNQKIKDCGVLRILGE
ncbi:Cd(II)/Pb(II)-responsive transcriptional regulator [Rheinheimera sp. UJ51]|uniref:Cd(II)/Pb(II)-responsive transcriptional regulator n=1 Tax=Rheinheimera sp. UJ51 TaxID=2892446 RepID=UPI001E4D0C5E|nr:Cd(II)/Pb(II)-responsive transcriptional regulator [Rheinheimera sp. UJ51]MCC5450714.1 Cd(II)/Pb(II)-responsive transcriptional regulator [Rheinheimera sp. UJ51]